MKNFNRVINVKNSHIVVLFILMMFFLNTSSFAQSTVNENIVLKDKIETNDNLIQEQSDSSTINFILWFMGSKQDSSKVILNDSTNKKKQIMTSGSAPNHLLIKTFLKKTVNFDSLIA